MKLRLLSATLMTLALALILNGNSVAQDKKKEGAGKDANTHEGTVVSVSGNKLVMKGKGADAKEHSHMVAKDAKITCDGKACKLEDLKAGQKVRVTTKAGDLTTATKVEALDKQKSFGGKGGDKGSEKSNK